MDEAAIAEPEGALLNFLRELSELEWRKYQHRTVVKLIDGVRYIEDESDHPPFISFRFKDEHDSIIQRLRSTISRFDGRVRWGMHAHLREGLHGTNWLICPEAVWAAREVAVSLGRSVGGYLAEAQPTLAEQAYQDLAALESALRTEFGR